MVGRMLWAEIRPTTPASSFARRTVGTDHLMEGGHVLGEATAPLAIIEFSDFQCPFCRRLQKTIADELARHPGQVSVRYRHYPLIGHSLAFPAAVAAECAARQGHFESLANLIFQHQDSLASIGWTALARRAGVADTVSFALCRKDPEIQRRIAADVAAGQRLGLTGTPALVIGDQLVVGALPLDTLEALLREQARDHGRM
jgi:protein-disulfide isomerase